MEPGRYCAQLKEELRLWPPYRRDRRFERRQRAQLLVVLAHLDGHCLEADSFESELRKLAEEADLTRRPSLAEAARAILRDWQQRSAQA